MIKYLKFVFVALAMCISAGLMTAPEAQAQLPLPSTATKLYIYNPSSPKTVVMCTAAGITPLSSISVKRVLPAGGTARALTTFNGGAYFIIGTGEKYEMYNGTSPYTLSAIAIGFGQFPNVCPQSQVSGINQTPCTLGAPQPGYPQGFPSGGCCPPMFPDVNNPTTNTVFPDLPNGSNSAEITINVASGPETIDLSCNKGANCKIQMTVTPPASGPYWTAAGCPPAVSTACGGSTSNTSCSGSGSSINCTRTYKTTTSTSNSWVNVALGCDDNCVDSRGCPRNGVGPYGCSQCNLNPDPAISCANGQGGVVGACTIAVANYTGQYCAAQNGNGSASGSPNQGTGCEYVRSPLSGSNFGGTIQVTYLGPLSPPGSCPTPATANCPSQN